MVSLEDCAKWRRVNSSLIMSIDNRQWRTSSLRLVQSTKSKTCKTEDMTLPLIIRKQGRLAKNYRVCKHNQFVYKQIIDDNKKTVHYVIKNCLCGHPLKYNSKEEMQCVSCGAIYDDLLNRRSVDNIYDQYMNDSNENLNERNASWDNLDLGWQTRFDTEAKELNQRIKRIREWEKGNKH